jgi:hypothetical protein
MRERIVQLASWISFRLYESHLMRWDWTKSPTAKCQCCGSVKHKSWMVKVSYAPGWFCNNEEALSFWENTQV